MRPQSSRTLRESSIAFIATLLVACGGPQKSEPQPASDPPGDVPLTVQPAPTESTAAPEAPAPVAAASSMEPETSASPLIVSIEPRSGSKLKGTAKFESTKAGVLVTLDIEGAPPGKHGAHIHQNADCSAKDAKSAGDHFNPQMHEHGLPPTEMRHLGDLGNIEVTKDGRGHLEITIAGASLNPGEKSSFVNRGVIIHEKEDNGGQPVGNAGNRIGCGEIKEHRRIGE